VRERREQRTAWPNDDLNHSGARAPPGIVTLARPQLAVPDGHPAGEARGETADSLRGQGNLRDQDNRSTPARQRRFQGAQINFGFAGAGDAVDKKSGRGESTDGTDLTDEHEEEGCWIS